MKAYADDVMVVLNTVCRERLRRKWIELLKILSSVNWTFAIMTDSVLVGTTGGDRKFEISRVVIRG